MNRIFAGAHKDPDWPDIDSPEWLSARTDIYLRYTVPSLKRQTHKGFTILLNCRKGTQELLAPYMDRILKAGVVVTFHPSPCPSESGGRVTQLPACVTTAAKNSGNNAAWLVRIDSDDMYGPDAIETVAEYRGDAKGILFQRGHVYVKPTDRLWESVHKSPPYYAERGMIEGANFVSQCVFGPHPEFLPKVEPAIIREPSFLVTRHDPGFSLHGWRRRLAIGRELKGDEKTKLLDYYGVPK